MAKAIVLFVMFFFGWWVFIVSLGDHLSFFQEHTNNNEQAIEMIDNLDAPAAAGNY